jgi:hypothetical protein
MAGTEDASGPMEGGGSVAIAGWRSGAGSGWVKAAQGVGSAMLGENWPGIRVGIGGGSASVRTGGTGVATEGAGGLTGGAVGLTGGAGGLTGRAGSAGGVAGPAGSTPW